MACEMKTVAMNSTLRWEEERKVYEFSCPWCASDGLDSRIEITPAELNCRRLIHGMFKANGTMVGPHSSSAQCVAHIATGGVWGCCRAILIVDQDGLHATAVPYES